MGCTGYGWFDADIIGWRTVKAILQWRFTCAHTHAYVPGQTDRSPETHSPANRAAMLETPTGVYGHCWPV